MWKSSPEIEQEYGKLRQTMGHAELGAHFRPELNAIQQYNWSQNFSKQFKRKDTQNEPSAKAETLEAAAPNAAPPAGNYYPPAQSSDILKDALDGDRIRLGFFTDQHLCSHKERLDVLNTAYDTFAEEGIQLVLNAGNWIDGESRCNQYEIHTVGFDAQLKYCLGNWPQRKGITTHYIAGSDHEGWYQARFGIDVGKRLEQDARAAGRNDLRYLGYVEHDLELPGDCGTGKRRYLRLMHPGGGSAMSLSLTPQRVIESFDIEDRPELLLIGHYHKAEYIPEYQGSSIIQGGCMQEQTVWQRKLRIKPFIGYWIVEMRLRDDGSIRSLKPEWYGGFRRGHVNGKFDAVGTRN